MDDDTVVRLKKLMADMDAGTSPLMNEDFREAMTMALFPSDAPSVEPDPAVEALRDAADDAGHQMGVVNCDVILSTLEEKLKRKQEAGSNPTG